MRKKVYRSCLIILLLLTMITGKEMLKREKEKETEESMESIADDLVIPGGMPVGIYMETDGVMVLGTEKVKAFDGKKYEPADRLVKEGDYIVAFNNEKINNKKELIEKVNRITEEEVVLKLKREGETLNVKLEPVKCKEGDYKLGIWVRDNTQGLGTITFLTKNSMYGALGHGIHDTDTGKLLNLSKGKLYRTSIRDIKKGKAGEPGGMEGIIIYNRYNVIGTITENTDVGIFGHMEKLDEELNMDTPVKLARKDDVEKGEAVIRCSVDGTVKDYKIEIRKMNCRAKELNKGIEIEVTDEELLAKTGGIVQGMSGSPILQNGKIVGAVTHVFVNDPTKGYGIFIENMLKNVK